MADLRDCFEAVGFTKVHTYIQSGNVIFQAPRTQKTSLEKKIEKALNTHFGYSGFVVVLSASELQAVVAEAPRGFGHDRGTYRYDVLFFKHPMTPQTAFSDIPTRANADTKHVGKHAVYFTRVTKEASESQLSKIISLPVYKHITIRNWNTTITLQHLLTT